MDDSFKLSDQEHERAYQKIENDLLQGTRPIEQPRVIITGGQPGSGKSKLLEQGREQFPDGNVVVINGDDLRVYHPRQEEILKVDDKRFAERTDPDSRAWTKRLFDRAIESKLNIIFESTMRDAGPISETMKRLRDQGYHITAKVIATHERMSKTGIYKRYEEQKAAKGYGRWSELSSHDAGYEGMPRTVDHIERNKLVDRLEVYNRAGELLCSNALKAGEWENSPKALDAIEAERQRKPTEREIQELRSDWQRIYDLMEQRKVPLRENEQARSTYQKIERGLQKGRDLEKPKENPQPELKIQDILKAKKPEKKKERGRDDDLIP